MSVQNKLESLEECKPLPRGRAFSTHASSTVYIVTNQHIVAACGMISRKQQKHLLIQLFANV